jgi:hypothetical protein
LHDLWDEEKGQGDGMLLEDSVSVLNKDWVVVVSSLKKGYGYNWRDWFEQ